MAKVKRIARQRRGSADAAPSSFAQLLTGAMRLLRRLAFLVLGIAFTVFVSQRLHAFVFRSDYFTLRDIAVTIMDDGPSTGFEETLELHIRSLLCQEGYGGEDLALGCNLLLVRTERVRELIETLPRVHKAEVRKAFPDRLEIDAHQRRPVALVLHNPLLAIDREGVVIDEFTTRHKEAVTFPYISGIDVSAAQLGERLDHESLTWALLLVLSLQEKAPDLSRSISEVHCGRDRNITLVLKGGTEIRFGAENPLGSMPKLEAFIHRMGEPQKFAYINLQFDRQVPSMTKQEAMRQRVQEQMEKHEG